MVRAFGRYEKSKSLSPKKNIEAIIPRPTPTRYKKNRLNTAIILVAQK